MTAKALDTAIAAHLAGGQHTLAWAFEIVRSDAVAYRRCSGSRAAVIDGQTYTPVDGMTLSSIACSIGLNVDNLQVTVGDSAEILREDILDGVWDGARYRIFQYNWASPSDGIIPWPSGFIANAEPRVGAFDFEARDFRQALQQDTTRIHQFGCPWVLGDANCRKDLTAFTTTAVAITGVTSQRVITASSLSAAAADHYGNGRLMFTSGANANGIWRQIDTNTGGQITLVLPLLRTPLIGDLFTIIAGCRHRPDEDCRDKFANKVNYGGCDTKPTVSDIVNGELAA